MIGNSSAKPGQTTKHSPGMNMAGWMPPKRSEYRPVRGGTIAPPMIDIMRKGAPEPASSFRSRTPSAKMVGNMMDMKKLVSHNEPTASHPEAATASMHRHTFIAP